MAEHDVECRISSTVYDARDVLDGYLGALNKLDQKIVCDAAELGYPKDLIKFVLRHCIKTIEEQEKRTFLRNAYLALASYQKLADEERAAATLISEISASSGSLTEEKEARIHGAATSLRAVIERHKAELAILEQELKILQANGPTNGC